MGFTIYGKVCLILYIFYMNSHKIKSNAQYFFHKSYYDLNNRNFRKQMQSIVGSIEVPKIMMTYNNIESNHLHNWKRQEMQY